MAYKTQIVNDQYFPKEGVSKSWEGGAWWASEVKSYDAGLSGAQRCKQLRLGGRRAEPVEICAPDPAVLCAVHPVLCTSWCVLCTLLGCVLCLVDCMQYSVQSGGVQTRPSSFTRVHRPAAPSLRPPLFCTSGNRAILQLFSALWWLTDRRA